MNNDEYDILISKCTAVIAHCNTADQLDVALKYRGLVCKKLGLDIEKLKCINFAHKTGMAFGSAISNIKHRAEAKTRKSNE